MVTRILSNLGRQLIVQAVELSNCKNVVLSGGYFLIVHQIVLLEKIYHLK